MRNNRTDQMYVNMAIEAAYHREDSIKKVKEVVTQIAELVSLHDPKIKGGNIDVSAINIKCKEIHDLVAIILTP